MHELADFTEADLSGLTRTSIANLAQWMEAFYKKRCLGIVKLVACFPIHGNVETIIYSVWQEGSPEHLRVFRNKDEAIAGMKTRKTPTRS